MEIETQTDRDLHYFRLFDYKVFRNIKQQDITETHRARLGTVFL